MSSFPEEGILLHPNLLYREVIEETGGLHPLQSGDGSHGKNEFLVKTARSDLGKGKQLRSIWVKVPVTPPESSLILCRVGERIATAGSACFHEKGALREI